MEQAKKIWYTLDKTSKKYHCPSCNEKTFVKYWDIQGNRYAPDVFGRCDRAENCGYYKLPPPKETTCIFVPYDSINEISNKAVVVRQGQKTHSIPKSVIFETLTNGAYMAAYYVTTAKDKHNKPLNLEHDANDVRQYDNDTSTYVHLAPEPRKKEPTPTVHFDLKTFEATLDAELYERNTFIHNLLCNIPHPFPTDLIEQVISLYLIGTIGDQYGYRRNATTFPFINIDGNIRFVQVKEFDGDNHTTGTDSLNAMLIKKHKAKTTDLPQWLKQYQEQPLKINCLFGEHLLKKYPNNPIALVEAPKTAIYGALYFGLPKTPKDFIWLATFSISTFKIDRLNALKGRNVCVFPDLSKDGKTFEDWRQRAKEYQGELKGTTFEFFDLLEDMATDEDRQKGYDIADFLIQHDWRNFRPEADKEQKPSPPPPTTKDEPKSLVGRIFGDQKLLETDEGDHIWLNTSPYKQRNDGGDGEHLKQPIKAIVTYYEGVNVSSEPIQVNKHRTIVDPSKFVDAHLHVLQSNGTTVDAKNESLSQLTFLKKHIENSNKSIGQLFENNK